MKSKSGKGKVIGQFKNRLVSSGDLAFWKNKLYGSAKSDHYATDVLVKINIATGRARIIGETGFNNAYGLSFSSIGQLFGISDVGIVLQINTETGQGLPVFDVTEFTPLWGMTGMCP